MTFERMTLGELAAYLEGEAELTRDEEERLQRDRRSGARLLFERYRLRRRRQSEELLRLHNMLKEEQVFWKRGMRYVAGVDEAGRGPLAGPVVAAAVILPPETIIPGLNDSKQLAPAAREALYPQIRETALGIATGIAPVEVIDRINIYGALMQAMREALHHLPHAPDMVLVDGFPIRDLALSQKAIRGGDTLSLSIAAASVVAKITRDRIMVDLHRRYPAYGFDRHKGYATEEHRRALSRWGPCPAHRRSFRLDYDKRAEEEALS